MRRRSTLIRFLAFFWAALQVASPGVSAIADGRLAAENASGPATHVEATTTEACPVVHSPDCAVCRYLSVLARGEQACALLGLLSAESREPRAETRFRHAASLALPLGRAPPTI